MPPVLLRWPASRQRAPEGLDGVLRASVRMAVRKRMQKEKVAEGASDASRGPIGIWGRTDLSVPSAPFSIHVTGPHRPTLGQSHPVPGSCLGSALRGRASLRWLLGVELVPLVWTLLPGHCRAPGFRLPTCPACSGVLEPRPPRGKVKGQSGGQWR